MPNLKRIDSPKVSESNAIRESLKWILRAIALSMTERRRFIIARLAFGKVKRLCEAPTHTCKSKIRKSAPHLVILSVAFMRSEVSRAKDLKQ